MRGSGLAELLVFPAQLDPIRTIFRGTADYGSAVLCRLPIAAALAAALVAGLSLVTAVDALTFCPRQTYRESRARPDAR